MLIDAITSDMSVAEASEMLAKLQDCRVSVSIIECNKDVAEDDLAEVCTILHSGKDDFGNWDFITDSKLLEFPDLIEELKENCATLELVFD